jgi:hypothetical protein
MRRSFLLKLILFVAGFVLVERFCHSVTEGFRPHKILSTLSFNPDYATPPATDAIRQLLAQPFYFLGSGGQCYAFESKDKKSILKVFKHHHMRPESFFNRAEKQERLRSIFLSFKLAYDRFQERTGLLFLHLNKTDDLQQTLTLFDAIGIAHAFDLDNLEFALQKKATLAYPHIAACMQRGDLESAKASVQSLIELMVERSRAGLADRDPIVKRNFGFIGNRAVEIDLGSFYEDPMLTSPPAYKKQLLYESFRFKQRIQKRHPELYPFLEELIRKKIEVRDH